MTEDFKNAITQPFDRVLMNISYYIPVRVPVPDSPKAHTGLVNEFTHSFDDVHDDTRAAVERLLKRNNNFEKIIRNVRLGSSLTLQFDTSARDTKLILVQPGADGPAIETGLSDDPRDQEDALKVMVPYEAGRRFLKFWQDKIDGPLQGVRWCATSLLTAADFRARREYGIN